MYKLIIVDDDSFMLKMLKEAFNWQEMGFTVLKTFSSSVDCVEYLKHNFADALLTDIKMPNISGLDLAKICSELYPNIGIILTSAYTNFEYAREAIKYNVIDYVLKPISDDDLQTAMECLKKYLDKFNTTEIKNIENNSEIDNNTTILKIREYIAEHYKENITIGEISAHVMLNPNYLGSYFKKHTGESFSHYLQAFRLQKACDFLENTDIKIATIAEMVGYKITTPFYKNFYRQYNLTPVEYRKKYQKLK